MLLWGLASRLLLRWRETREGELVFAGIMKVNTIFPLQVKAEAIKWALSLAPGMGNKCIIVELDCQYCVHLLNDLAVPPIEGSSHRGLILGICCLFLISFLWSGRLGCVMQQPTL